MEYLHALLLTFLELTFIFVGLALLYSQRRAIGKAPFFMSLGLLLLFSHFIGAADLRVTLIGTLDFQVGNTIIFLPILAALLMVYITEGTLAAQRTIIGIVVLYGLYLYIGEITRLECNWLGFSITSGLPAAALDHLLGESRNSMNLVALSHLLDLFVLPIAYTRLKNFGLNRFFCVCGGFLVTQLIGTALFLGIATAIGLERTVLDGNFIARLIASVWLAVMTTIYLEKLEVDIRSGEKSPLDILFAFIGSYGRSKELEANLREWEDRYRMVLENAGELIIMLNPAGRIIDANIAAGKLLGVENPAQLINQLLYPRIRLLDSGIVHLGSVPEQPVQFRCVLDEKSPRRIVLSCTLSPIRMRGQILLVLIGRDITEETRLAEEKARLSEQLAHSQRIEALGMLAGGIAHDFNNYIHAILGHIDVITLLHPPEDPEVTRHLEKVTTIAEQAGHLTSQLLGFARKGKYQVVDLDIQPVIENSLALLGPRKRQDLEISLHVLPQVGKVRADTLQLQQVLLNLMINAIDAMANNTDEKRLTLFAGPASEAPLPFTPPPEHADAKLSDYVFIQVADNGCGMSEAIRRKLFEPFFTTKPVGRGTGMGLAMVYGTVTNHQGWIQLETAPGKGSNFCLFLPRARYGRKKSE